MTASLGSAGNGQGERLAAASPTPRIAIVTGAGRGIGAAIADRLAVDGLMVAVLDLDVEHARETAKRIVARGGTSVPIAADVSDEDAVERAVARVAEELGPPTVLVNNAGITRDNLIHRMSVAEWNDVLDVHGRGAFLMSRAAQRHMVAQGWGRIVMISSGSALGNKGQANYSMAKAGLQGLTKTLALELGRFNVTVNAVAPGFIETDMTKAVADRLGMTFADYRAQAAQRTAVQRVGQPEDVAGAVAFFIDESASYISGQVLYVAGGPRG